MSRAGRDARGRYQRDDRNLVDALAALCDAVAPVLAFMDDPAMDAATRISAAHAGFEALEQARTTLAFVDVGTKPGKDTNDAQ